MQVEKGNKESLNCMSDFVSPIWQTAVTTYLLLPRLLSRETVIWISNRSLSRWRVSWLATDLRTLWSNMDIMSPWPVTVLTALFSTPRPAKACLCITRRANAWFRLATISKHRLLVPKLPVIVMPIWQDRTTRRVAGVHTMSVKNARPSVKISATLSWPAFRPSWTVRMYGRKWVLTPASTTKIAMTESIISSDRQATGCVRMSTTCHTYWKTMSGS